MAKSIQETYVRFAENEAHEYSPVYEAFALAVAESDEVRSFLSTLPPPKRRPTLLFASIRHLFGTPMSSAALVETIEQNWDDIRALMLSRSTQTNEPARCATLLPALCRLPQPLALLELGASAGLCLLPDRYAYSYNDQRLGPNDESFSDTVLFPCRANALTPIPTELPTVVWRTGLDLNPVNLLDDEEVAWLENLVWPGQEDRAERLRLAIQLARREPPNVVKGNLLTDVCSLAETAPSDITLVVFHSAALAYVDSKQAREQFAKKMSESDAVWISNEAPRVFPEFLQRLAQPIPDNHFLLSVNGTPVASTGPYGQSIDWF